MIGEVETGPLEGRGVIIEEKAYTVEQQLHGSRYWTAWRTGLGNAIDAMGSANDAAKKYVDRRFRVVESIERTTVIHIVDASDFNTKESA